MARGVGKPDGGGRKPPRDAKDGGHSRLSMGNLLRRMSRRDPSPPRTIAQPQPAPVVQSQPAAVVPPQPVPVANTLVVDFNNQADFFLEVRPAGSQLEPEDVNMLTQLAGQLRAAGRGAEIKRQDVTGRLENLIDPRANGLANLNPVQLAALDQAADAFGVAADRRAIIERARTDKAQQPRTRQPATATSHGLPAQSLAPESKQSSPHEPTPRDAPGTHRFTDEQRRFARTHHLTDALIAECATPDSADIAPIGRGHFNAVAMRRVILPGGAYFGGVFKKERTDPSQVGSRSQKAGIDPQRMTWSVRNVATSKLDQLLWQENGVIPPTHLVLGDGEMGCIMQTARGVSPIFKGQRDILVRDSALAAMLRSDHTLLQNFAEAHGFTSATIAADANIVTLRYEEVKNGQTHKLEAANEIDYDHPGVRRELTRLQILDALTAQPDRHRGNYFIHAWRDPEGQEHVSATGVDNDMAFGSAVRDPNAAAFGFMARLPGVIDHVTHTRLLRLRPQDIDAACEGLSADEVAATKSRLKAIQAWALSLPENCILKTDQEWRSPHVATALGIVPHDDAVWRTPGAPIKAVLKKAKRTSYVAHGSAVQDAARAGQYTPRIPFYREGALEQFFAPMLQGRAHEVRRPTPAAAVSPRQVDPPMRPVQPVTAVAQASAAEPVSVHPPEAAPETAFDAARSRWHLARQALNADPANLTLHLDYLEAGLALEHARPGAHKQPSAHLSQVMSGQLKAWKNATDPRSRALLAIFERLETGPAALGAGSKFMKMLADLEKQSPSMAALVCIYTSQLATGGGDPAAAETWLGRAFANLATVGDVDGEECSLLLESPLVSPAVKTDERWKALAAAQERSASS
jgi:hypothetical protein